MTLNFHSVSAFMGTLVGLGYLFNYLENTVRNSTREELVLWFRKVGNRSFSDALSSCNGLFLRTFDHIYSRGRSTLSDTAWLWLIGMLVVSATLVPLSQLLGLSSPSLQSVLVLGAVTGCMFSVPYYWAVQQRSSPKTKEMLGPILVLIFFVASLVVFNQIHRLPSGTRTGLWFSLYLLMLIFLFRAAVSVIAQFLRSGYKVSPFRGMITSLGAMLLIGLFNQNMVESFISDLGLYGWSISGYLLLNICVDSFSLLETRFILRLASAGSVIRFAGVMILDILASATIFLVIPIASGNLSIFLDAIVFKGSHPWIGILFWSSFSTSVFFYLYLLSAGALAALQSFVKGFLRLDHFLPISEKPFRCLGLVAMVITTLLFVVLWCIM